MHEESKRQPKNHSQINESEPKSKEFCPIPRPIYHQTSIEINYEIVKTVGQGEFAKVKLGRCKRTGSEVIFTFTSVIPLYEQLGCHQVD